MIIHPIIEIVLVMDDRSSKRQIIFLPVDERKDPMSEHFLYSIGKWNGEPPLGSASFPENHQKPAESVSNSHQPVSLSSFPGNTHLIFEVDENDHSIVVMIVDEASSKVIRTVPGGTHLRPAVRHSVDVHFLAIGTPVVGIESDVQSQPNRTHGSGTYSLLHRLLVKFHQHAIVPTVLNAQQQLGALIRVWRSLLEIVILPGS
jgi:hypothetical protein